MFAHFEILSKKNSFGGSVIVFFQEPQKSLWISMVFGGFAEKIVFGSIQKCSAHKSGSSLCGMRSDGNPARLWPATQRHFLCPWGSGLPARAISFMENSDTPSVKPWASTKPSSPYSQISSPHPQSLLSSSFLPIWDSKSDWGRSLRRGRGNFICVPLKELFGKSELSMNYLWSIYPPNTGLNFSLFDVSNSDSRKNKVGDW